MQQPTPKKITAQGDPVAGYFNPILVIRHLWRYKDLIRQLTGREVALRYKGSFLGVGWSFVQPVMMLAVYTFVFSVVFKARWGIAQADGGSGGFALALFIGLITYGIFAEIATSAPHLVLQNTNYVKKVVFPLEILPVVRTLSILINSLFSLVILLGGLLLLRHGVAWTFLLLPLVWLPLVLFSLGCGYFLASLGVFIRDVGTFVGVLTTMLFFLTPIFYPIEAVPERFRIFIGVNPLAVFVENARKVAVWGMLPDWKAYVAATVFATVFFLIGFVWFMKSKRAFADVL